MLRVGAVYFLAVFAVGFALGTIRTLWVAPQVGARAAELLEMPLMLLAVVGCARLLVRRHPELTHPGEWIGVGAAGLALLLAAEFSVVLWLRGLTLAEYIAERDPVSGAVYAAALVAFAAMPLILSRIARSDARARRP